VSLRKVSLFQKVSSSVFEQSGPAYSAIWPQNRIARDAYLPRRALNGRRHKAPEKKRDDAREGITEHVPDLGKGSGRTGYAASSRHQQSYEF